MSRKLRVAALFLVPLLVSSAGTITNFEILNSSNPSQPGGVWDNGEAYSGNFSVDLSSLPPSGPFSLPISSFYFQSNVSLGFTAFAPAYGDSANLTGSFLTTVGGINGYLDTVNVDYGLFILQFVEPAGTFKGGLIIFAADAVDGVQDTHGTALAIDPSLVIPEPRFTLLFGLVLLIASGLLKRRFA